MAAADAPGASGDDAPLAPDATSRSSPVVFPAGFAQIGRRFGEWFRGGGEPVVEIDRAVIGWYPPYRATVEAIARELHDAAIRWDHDQREAVVAADPESRDAVRRDVDRNGWRILGVFGGAGAAASAITGANFLAGGTFRAIDPIATAWLLGVSSVVAIVCVLLALFPRSVVGTPGFGTASIAGLAAISSTGGAFTLWRARSEWDETTTGWWLTTAAAATVSVAVFAWVLAMRSRLSASRRRAHVEALDRIRAGVEPLVAELAARGDAEVRAAWDALPAEARDGLLEQRRIAVAAIVARGGRVDAERILADPPGVASTARSTDFVHSSLDFDDAMRAQRQREGRA